MRPIHWIALTLVLVGALNWGLVGLFQFDLVAALFGAGSPLSRAVYTIVGLAAVALAYTSLAAVSAPREGSLATR